MNSIFTKAGVTKAVILAGGQGTLLAPLNTYCPTWMFPVLNKPLIEYTIDFLKKNGLKSIIIVSSVKDKMPDFLVRYNDNGINIRYQREDVPRGTAGALKDIEEFIGEEPFLVVSSNLFSGQLDLDKFINFHVRHKSVATIGIDREKGSDVEERITVAGDTSIESFNIIHPSTDRRSQWASSGIYLFEPAVLKFISASNYMDIKEQLIPALLKENLHLSACETEGFHLCLNNISDYINVHRSLLLNDAYWDYIEDKEEISQGVWAGKNTVISPGAYLVGPIVLGSDCTVENWAQIIGPAVIGNRCQIDKRVFVRESILWDDICLSDGAKIEYSIIGEPSYVPNNFSIKNMVIVNDLRVGDVNLIPLDQGIKGTLHLSDITFGGATHKLYRTLKRIMDIVFSAAGLVLLLPLFLLIAIAIKIDSQGPVFYIQNRCGKNGKPFGMVKFRTMVADAEKLHEELIARKDTDGPMFKMMDDPRITKTGRLLRETSIDEIPQLFNVLKGEMSLVGPRPLIMKEMKFSPSWRDTRLKVKPGITGLWQIQGRSEASFHDWIKYDVSYIKNQSLWLDIKILYKTIRVVLRKVGAY